MLARLRNTKNPVSLYKQKLYVFDEKIDWLQKAESTKMAVITIFKFINIGFLILIPSVTDVILLWENTRLHHIYTVSQARLKSYKRNNVVKANIKIQ